MTPIRLTRAFLLGFRWLINAVVRCFEIKQKLCFGVNGSTNITPYCNSSKQPSILKEFAVLKRNGEMLFTLHNHYSQNIWADPSESLMSWLWIYPDVLTVISITLGQGWRWLQGETFRQGRVWTNCTAWLYKPILNLRKDLMKSFVKYDKTLYLSWILSGVNVRV